MSYYATNVCRNCAAQKQAKPASRNVAQPLSHNQRARLENEADDLAARFVSGDRHTPAHHSMADITIHPQQRTTAKPMMRKALPISESAQFEDAIQLEVPEEDQQLSSETKGMGAIDETAETGVGEPEANRDKNSEEAAPVLAKGRANSAVAIDQAPPSLSGGEKLAASDRRQMETFFGRDFSAVRVHTDRQSQRYTEHIGALAATKSNHIFFSSKATPSNDKRLLAHELTHVVQQRQAPSLDTQGSTAGSAISSAHGTPVQRQTLPAISAGPVDWQLYQSTICQGQANEHPSTQPRDFPATYISTINVSLTNQRVTLDWTGPSVAEAEQIVRTVTGDGIINCSTGAGVRGQTSCNNTAHSNRSGSCCTPIGSFTLGAQACVTPRNKLENFSGFGRSGVGFHYYSDVPSHPASHGCVRLHRGASKIIFDNARTNHTSVVVSGGFSGTHTRYRSCS